MKNREKNVSKLENMKKINFKEKGITLIALIVTIIILLILAGVALSTAIRTKWIISKSKVSSRKV